MSHYNPDPARVTLPTDAQKSAFLLHPLFRLLKNLSKYLIIGAPGRIRTSDPLVRSQILYPTELRAHKHGGERGIRTLDEISPILP